MNISPSVHTPIANMPKAICYLKENALFLSLLLTFVLSVSELYKTAQKPLVIIAKEVIDISMSSEHKMQATCLHLVYHSVTAMY